MKRVGLFLLAAVLMGFSVTGCAKKDADPVGIWQVIMDEGCDGADVAWIMHIYDNGTFTVEGAIGGTWSTNKDNITINFEFNVFVLSGSVDGGAMSGTFTGAASGCWTAVRTSTTP